MRGLHQTVKCTIEIKQGEPCECSVIVDELEGTTNVNLRSKIAKWIDRQLIMHCVGLGAVIKIDISPTEIDKYANPER